jgi:VWFA-related protein
MVAASLVGTVSTGAAQSSNQQSPQSGYTLHANAREVITDVTVTDRNGNPIHGLSEPAFHIFDNGKPQRLVTFEEHRGTERVSLLQASDGDAYSNDVVLHPPRALNLILIDTTWLGFVDQVYLNLQLEQFIKQLPPDEPFAVLARRGHLTMFASFTSDHKRLLEAVHAVIPRFERSMDGYAAPNKVVDELCDYLQQFPGRKNVFWFQGASGLKLRPDPTSFVNYQDMSVLYDELESARIALYPVDVRGIQALADPHVASDPSMSEHIDMEDEADATGGHAVINRNDIAGEVKHIADNDASYYTLSYSPQEVKLDNKWHKIKVQVDGSDYQISYRQGYFDDGANLGHGEGPARQRLLQGGSVVSQVHGAPIALQVLVTPREQVADSSAQAVIRTSAPPKKGERPYNLHYSVPLDVFPERVVGTENHLSLGLGVFAFDQHGRSISRIVDKVTLSVAQERMNATPADARIGFDQQINLPNGEDFLYVAVWNQETGRTGTVQIPLAVEKAHTH